MEFQSGGQEVIFQEKYPKYFHSKQVCAKLDQDRTAAFDIIVDDYFPDFSEVCGDSRKECF